MAETTASLGLSFESAEAERNMRNLEAAAKRAGVSVDEMRRRVELSEKGISPLGTTIGKTGSLVYEAAKATAAWTSALGKSNQESDKYAREADRIRRETERAAVALRIAESASSELSSVARNLTSNLGGLGNALGSLGPAGLAVGLVYGGVVALLYKMSSAAMDLADKAGNLKDFAETTGFTALQLQGLEKSGMMVGVSSEKVTGALEKFSVAMDDVKKQAGSTYASLLEVNPALADQISKTESLSDAWDLLAKSMAQTDLEQKNKTARAFFGRGGIPITRLAGATNEAGGIDAMIAAMNKLDFLTKEQIDRWDDFGDAINMNMSTARTVITSIFADAVLQTLNKVTQLLLDMARALKEFALSDDFKKFLEWSKTPAGMALLAGAGGAMLGGSVGGPLGAFAGGSIGAFTGAARGIQYQQERPPLTPGVTRVDIGGGVDAETASLKRQKEELERNINMLERRNAALGSSVTGQQTFELSLKKMGLQMLNNKPIADELRAGQERLTQSYNAGQFSQYVGLLGQAATVEDQLRVKRDALAVAANNNVNLTKDQYDNQIRLTRETANGVLQTQAQIDATKMQTEAARMGAGAAAEFNVVQSRLNEDARNGIRMSQEDEAALRARAKAFGEATQAAANDNAMREVIFDRQTMFMSDTEKQIANVNRRLHGDDWQAYGDSALSNLTRINSQMRGLTNLLTQSATNFSNDLINGLREGKSLMSSLGTAATNLSQQLQSGALTSLFKGDFVAAGIQGVASVITGIFGRRQADAEAAEKAAKETYNRITTYNQRIQDASLDTRNLVGQLQQFDVNAQRERQEEYTKGSGAIAALEQALAAERIAIVKKSVEESQAAFDALVTQAKTATQTAVSTLTSAAENLAASMTSLGRSLGGVNDNVLRAVEALQHNFADALVSKINSSFGADYISSVIALARQHTSDLADAATLGINSSLVNGAFSAQVQKIVDENKLMGESFQNLITLFPQLNGQVREFSSVATETAETLAEAVATAEAALKSAQSAVDQARDALVSQFQALLSAAESALSQGVSNLTSVYKAQFETAQQNVISSYTSQTQAIQATIDKMSAYVTSLRTFQQSLNIGTLSPLSSQEQLAASRQAFLTTSRAAASGDADAIGALQGVSQTYLEQSRAYNASSAAYAASFKEVQDALKRAQDVASKQVTEGQQQIDLMKAQVTALGILVENTSSLTSLRDAITEYQKIAVLGSAIQQQFGISISTAVVSGSQTVINSINALGAAMKNYADTVKMGQEITKQTGVDVFSGISKASSAVVDAVKGTTAAVNTGTGGTILAVNGTIFAVYDSKTATINAVSSSGAQTTAALNTGLADTSNTVLAGANKTIAAINATANSTIEAVSGSAIRTIAAVQNITNASNGTAGVIISVDKLSVAQAELISAQSLLTRNQAAAAAYNFTQTEVANSQLQQLIALNQNVIRLSAVVASPATAAPATDAINAAAKAAAEAAKTWHYPTTLPPELLVGKDVSGFKGIGYQMQWEQGSEALRAEYRAKHPEARYQAGGLVSNGMFNRDSVSAMLAGGEFVINAARVNAQTLPVAQYMNSTGRVPMNDNRENFVELGRIMSEGSASIVQALREGFASLREETKMNTMEAVMKSKVPQRAGGSTR